MSGRMAEPSLLEKATVIMATSLFPWTGFFMSPPTCAVDSKNSLESIACSRVDYCRRWWKSHARSFPPFTFPNASTQHHVGHCDSNLKRKIQRHLLHPFYHFQCKFTEFDSRLGRRILDARHRARHVCHLTVLGFPFS